MHCLPKNGKELIMVQEEEKQISEQKDAASGEDIVGKIPVPAGSEEEKQEKKQDENDPLTELREENEKLRQEMAELVKNKDLADRFDAAEKQLQELSAVMQTVSQNSKEQAELISALTTKQESNERKLAQALRENANFQIQVRSGMQHDLEELKTRVSGDQFIPLLKEISEMYVDYLFLTENDLSADEIRKNLKMMFSQMEDFFEENGAQVCVSQEGSPRRSRSCRVVGKIPTDDPAKHNTVAKSRKPGIIRDKTILQSEYVDLYVYEERKKEPQQDEN